MMTQKLISILHRVARGTTTSEDAEALAEYIGNLATRLATCDRKQDRVTWALVAKTLGSVSVWGNGIGSD